MRGDGECRTGKDGTVAGHLCFLLPRHRKVLARVLVATALALGSRCAAAEIPASKTPTCASPIVLPFDGRKGFVLIEGSVGDTHGVFMIDTGTPYRLLLNRDAVPLEAGKTISAGAAASGQKITIKLHDQTLKVDLAGVAGLDLTEAMSGNFRFVGTEIGLHFLGFLGAEWLRQFVFMLDYRAGKLTLYPHTEPHCDVHEPAAGTILHFVVDHQLPLINLEIGRAPVPAHIDTGAAGSISLNAQARRRMQSLGLWHQHSHANGHVRITGVRYGQSRFVLDDLATEDAASGETAITLGYNFLGRYKSWWDYRNGTIRLDR